MSMCVCVRGGYVGRLHACIAWVNEGLMTYKLASIYVFLSHGKSLGLKLPFFTGCVADLLSTVIGSHLVVPSLKCT